ncbi:hypothetical protein K501DRAFT_235251 [Backusella circina FSU 941]|nr:hypothetical protein K501DRAFT_235251 [Backusella circina FSU 941]
MSTPQKICISERRATYPLHQRLKIYNPDTMARRLSEEKLPNKLVVHGVNILNKTSLDSDTAMSRIKQRRETHNRVERRRRYMLNHLVTELADLIPQSSANGEKCHRAKVLQYAIDHIKHIQQENDQLKVQLGLAPTNRINHHPGISSSLSVSPTLSATDSSSSSSSSPVSSPSPFILEHPDH